MKGYKHTELGWIPEDWEVKKLGVLTEKVGSGITPKGGEKVYRKSGRPFVRSQNVGWGDLILSDIAFIDDEIHKTFSSTEIKLNDVFLNITGASIGRSAVADNRILGGNVNQHVCIIRTKKEYLFPDFLNAYLISPKGQNIITSFQAGGNRQGLNYEQIKSFIVPLPSINEQKGISKILSTWDRSTEILTQLITAKQQLKKGLMQQLLTGKKRLPGFTSKWKEQKFEMIADVVMGQSPDGSTYNQDGRGKPLLNGPTEFTDRYPIKIQWTTAPSKLCKKDDILLCVRGSSTGRINIANDEYCIGRGIAAIRPKGDNDHSFVEYQLKNAVLKILSLTSGSTFPNIDSSSLKGIAIMVPEIAEQKAIGRVLSANEGEIELIKAQLDYLKQQKQGLMQQLLTGKKRVKG